MLGYFKDNSIYIDLLIKGFFTKGTSSLTGLMDTGYSGYLTLPYQTAFPLGLVLQGIKAYTLADGSTSYNFVCLGQLVINGGKEIFIPIDIQPKCMVLIGMGLLKKLEKDLLISFKRNKVEFKN